MTALTDLLAFQRETEALGQVMGRLGWDQETMMPRGASEQRAEEMAALEAVLHARRTDPRLGDWLAAADPETDAEEAQLREITRSYARNARIPARLATELAALTSRAQGIWAEARAADDFAAFAPTLEQVVALKREEAALLADGDALYDALLQDYEPGASEADLAAMFDVMRPRLVALRDRILGADNAPALNGTFDEAGQLELSRKLALAFGYDLDTGRIDLAVHPFSSGSGADVRITTRVAPADPFNCFYSTIHEVGHATYEQAVDPAYRLTAIGRGASMGVHESQSRIYENQLGRSRAFTGWLYERMSETFGDMGLDGPDAFYRAVNRVAPGFIRTEADEVQYNLHIMMRFDLERALMSGDLPVADLPDAWNARFASDFGVAVDKASNGVLQDVHWSVGLFGYFPTYALGNLYAGCLFEAMKMSVPGWEDALAQGDATPVTAWLRDALQVHGALRLPTDTIEAATGTAPAAEPLLGYLETKFVDLYNL
ncbi:MAG: carboxypeptidase M32 [Dinoroseobacter sp.]|nr:carboxypeptidase M32 [Dinoroseobacter sp.]